VGQYEHEIVKIEWMHDLHMNVCQWTGKVEYLDEGMNDNG
jgi:hypothetical protein